MSYPTEAPPTFHGGATRPRIRFEAFGEAWQLVKAQMGVWIVMTLLVFIIGLGAVVAVGVLFPRPQPTSFAEALAPPPIGISLITAVVTALVFGFLMAGYWKAALRQVDGETVAIGDLFSGGDVFAQIALYMLLVSVASALLQSIPLVGCFALPVQIVAGSLLWFTIPAIIHQRLPALEALQLSWRTLGAQFGPALGFYIVAGLIAMLGGIACGVGALVTLPLSLLAQAVVYRDFFMQPAAAPLDYPTTPPPYAPPPPPPPPAAPPPPSAWAPPEPPTSEAAPQPAPDVPPPAVDEPPAAEPQSAAAAPDVAAAPAEPEIPAGEPPAAADDEPPAEPKA